MKFGVTTYIWSMGLDKAVLAALPSLRERGFDGIEAPLFRPREFAASGIAKAAKANGLECVASAVLVDGLSLISQDAAIRAKTRAHMEDCVKTAADEGISLIAGPLYSPVGYLAGRRRTDDEWKWAVEAYQALGETLATNGVTIAIEPLNRFETYFLNTAADAAALCREIAHPNVGILFDTFHANIEEKEIAAGLRAAAQHLKHFHASENDRGAPGSGHVSWSAVFETLRAVGYDGWVNIEGFCFALGDVAAAASIWRDIEPTPETIAFEGVKFLRAGLKKSVSASC